MLSQLTQNAFPELLRKYPAIDLRMMSLIPAAPTRSEATVSLWFENKSGDWLGDFNWTTATTDFAKLSRPFDAWNDGGWSVCFQLHKISFAVATESISTAERIFWWWWWWWWFALWCSLFQIAEVIHTPFPAFKASRFIANVCLGNWVCGPRFVSRFIFCDGFYFQAVLRQTNDKFILVVLKVFFVFRGSWTWK